MNINRDKILVKGDFNSKETEKLPLKMAQKTPSKYPVCQWCNSEEIKLVPVSSIVNLKPHELSRYQKLWRRQGWPTKLYLCWFCRQNCELAHKEINLCLCPQCRECLIYRLENKPGKPAYKQLPVACLRCDWKKERLTKQEKKKIADQVIKSGLSYQRSKKTFGKNYFAWCSFCQEVIIAKQKDKEVKNRNQLRFWTDKVGEERLICNGCLRNNWKFQRLLLRKYRSRWRDYKSKGLI